LVKGGNKEDKNKKKGGQQILKFFLSWRGSRVFFTIRPLDLAW